MDIFGSKKVENNMRSQRVINVSNPILKNDASNKNYTDNRAVKWPILTTDTASKMYVDQSKTDMNGSQVYNIGTPTADNDATTKKYVDDHIFTGNMGNKKIINLANPIAVQDAATKLYVDTSIFTGDMQNKPITNLYWPTSDNEAATKRYVDNEKFTGNINFKKITNLSDPTVASDAATMNYVDRMTAMHIIIAPGVGTYTYQHSRPKNITIFSSPDALTHVMSATGVFIKGSQVLVLQQYEKPYLKYINVLINITDKIEIVSIDPFYFKITTGELSAYNYKIAKIYIT